MENRDGDSSNLVFFTKQGGLAHLARALAWQARGDRFESDILHNFFTILSQQKYPNKNVRVFSFIAIMFYTYILYSATLNKYYIGSCQDIQKRLQDHLNSRSKFTKVVKDWELKYYETFETRSNAMKRELQIKKMKSSKYIESLIETKG